MKKIEKATLNAETLIQARIEQLKKQGMTSRNANECAPHGMGCAHWPLEKGVIFRTTGRTPYPALEKALKHPKLSPRPPRAKAQKVSRNVLP